MTTKSRCEFSEENRTGKRFKEAQADEEIGVALAWKLEPERLSKQGKDFFADFFGSIFFKQA